MNNEEKQLLDDILKSFRQVQKSFYEVLWKETEQLGTTIHQARALKIIKDNPGIGVLELAQIFHISKSTMSGIVDRLVKSGYINSVPLETDRRSRTLTLTPAGEQLREETSRLFLEKMSILLEIPKEDIQHLLDVHQQIISKLKEK